MTADAALAGHGRIRPTGLPRPNESGPGNGLALIAFLTPTFFWMELGLVGRVFVPELILLGLLPFLLVTRGRMLAAPLPRTFLILAVLWLTAQVLTDLIRESDFRDLSRGWAKIAFTALNFCTLYLLLYGSRRRLVLFALGMAVGGYLSFLLNPSLLAKGDPWKFGLGFSTTLIAVLVSQWRPVFRIRLLPALPIFMAGAFSMAVGARSLAGVTILASLYVLGQQIIGRRSKAPAGASLARTFLFLVASVSAAAAIMESYGLMASRGHLGTRAQLQYERQGSGEFGVFPGGRTEFIAASRAVMDSPIVGHGSWARNPYYAAYSLELRDLGYEVLPGMATTGSDLIPTHSFLMGAWVEAGIMGAVFWLWVLLLVYRVLANLYMVREPLGPLIALIGFLMLWDILFSPFGAERRYTVPFNLVLMMFAWDVLRTSVPRDVLGGARRMFLPRRSRHAGRPGSREAGPVPNGAAPRWPDPLRRAPPPGRRPPP